MYDYKELKENMRRAAKRAYDIRLQSGDGGNLSVRIPGEKLILIKASGSSFGDLTDDNIVLTDFEGNVVTGKGKPSREIMTHIEIYNHRPDITAIFHSHSPWSVSIAQTTDFLPPVSLPLKMKIGEVPVLNAGEGHSDEIVVRALRVFLVRFSEIKAFIQRRHGLFTLSTNIIKAEHSAELIEEAAQIAQLIKIDGTFDLKEIENERT